MTTLPRLVKHESKEFESTSETYSDEVHFVEIIQYGNAILAENEHIQPSKLMVSVGLGYYDEPVIRFIWQRPETDEEYAERVRKYEAAEAEKVRKREWRLKSKEEKAAIKAAEKEARERATLALLMNKYKDSLPT